MINHSFKKLQINAIGTKCSAPLSRVAIYYSMTFCISLEPCINTFYDLILSIRRSEFFGDNPRIKNN